MRFAKATLFGALATLTLVGFHTALGRQTPPSARGASTLERAVVETIDTGANLFNAGEDAACYRLYQGALIGLKPSLEGHPETYRVVLTHQAEAGRAKTVAEKAFALRRALDAILVMARTQPAVAAQPAAPTKPAAETAKTGKPEPPKTPVVVAEAPKAKAETMPREPVVSPPPLAEVPKAKPAGRVPAANSLWNRLGGMDVVKPAVTEWIGRCLTDPRTDFTRGGKYPLDAVARANFEQLMVQYLSELTGGPETYTGRSMKDAHLGMKITEDQYQISMRLLGSAFRSRGVGKEELEELIGVLARSQSEVVSVGAPSSTPTPTPTPAPGIAAAAPDMKKPAAAPTPAPTAPAAPANAPKTLWDRVGGDKEMAAIIKELIDTAVTDPKVDLTRGGKYKFDDAAKAKLSRKFLEYFSSRMGGPYKYEGKPLKDAHAKMGINADQFDAMGGDLIVVMRRHGIGDAVIDEMLGIFNEAFEPVVENK